MEKEDRSSASSKRAELKPEEISSSLKRLAAEQPIRVELTEEQYRGLLGTWDERDPKRPAQITFFVGDRSVAEMTVAAYRYRGDTCCV